VGGEVVEVRRAHHGVPGASERVTPELVEGDEEHVRSRSHVASVPAAGPRTVLGGFIGILITVQRMTTLAEIARTAGLVVRSTTRPPR
jgi:hypothetical protein